MISFTVPGRPVPQGGMKAFARGNRAFVTHQKPKELGDYRARIAIAARDAGVECVSDPICMTVYFYIDRPKGHYGTGRNAGQLKPSAPGNPATRPDIDKLLRAVLDGLTGVAFRDDSQVVDVFARKYYGDGSPGTTISIEAAA